MLTRREPQDGRLDVRGRLAPLGHAEPTAVLGRARVLGILAREIAEVLAREHAAVDLVGATPRRRPAVLARAGPGHEEDVAGLESQARLELFPVGDQVAVDLLLGDGDTQRHLAPDHALHEQLLANALPDRLDDQALGLDHLLEFCRRGGPQPLLDLSHPLRHLGILDGELLALGLLDLEPLLDDAGEDPLPELRALLALGRARQLVLVEVVGLRLIELIQGDGIAVHHADDPVHDGLGVGRQGGAREERRADLAGGRGARRRPLGLADEGHPRGNGAARESGGDACDEDEPDRAPHARDSSSARSASRTGSQGPVGIIASSVNSFRMVTPLPRRPTTTKMRSGVTGVDGAKVTSARPPPASRRSTPSRRLSTRSPTTSSSATTAGGGGPKRSASSVRIWATSSSSPMSASRW